MTSMAWGGYGEKNFFCFVVVRCVVAKMCGGGETSESGRPPKCAGGGGLRVECGVGNRHDNIVVVVTRARCVSRVVSSSATTERFSCWLLVIISVIVPISHT